MVSKNQLKLIKSLHQKKYRNEHGLFFVEGLKTVKELLNSDLNLFELYATKQYSGDFLELEIHDITENDLKKISALRQPSGVLAVFQMPKTRKVDFGNWVMVLDDVRDPGNLGAIIRLCDWFGIEHIVCSNETVDVFNPKVLQATMGSIARVNVVYQDLEPFLAKASLPVYGTYMQGASIYKEDFPKSGVLIMGNEANGIAPKLKANIDKSVTIPQFGNLTAESLNVATATAIVLSEIRSNS
ncbi:TrmH family RNA methyltransferase [Croceitalea marina]|uniref:TrmH family RNA methyltransferase n=1 Tax=Croceitalea marina TaxID=1775166 RepID=A0ABW5MWQ8_9FLAO